LNCDSMILSFQYIYSHPFLPGDTTINDWFYKKISSNTKEITTSRKNDADSIIRNLDIDLLFITINRSFSPKFISSSLLVRDNAQN
jgi:hypothetical protein